MRSPDRPGATSPHTSNSENCSSVPGTPAPESYLRFSFQELGDTLGVRPGELLTALQEYAGGVEFDVPPPEGSEDFPAPLSPGQICKTPSSVGGGGISGMLVVMQPASSPDPGRMVSSMMTSSRVGSGEVAPPPPATEEPYFDIAGQHQPISQLMEDLAQDAGLAAFFPTDAAGEDLEAPLLWSMEDVVGEHIRTETSESHGYLIKVVEHGMPMFSAPPSPRTSIMSESLPAELSYLQEQLGKEIHEVPPLSPLPPSPPLIWLLIQTPPAAQPHLSHT